MENLAAYTKAGTNPAFISINRLFDRTVEIIVRNEVNEHCNCVGTTASIKLTEDQYLCLLAQLKG